MLKRNFIAHFGIKLKQFHQHFAYLPVSKKTYGWNNLLIKRLLYLCRAVQDTVISFTVLANFFQSEIHDSHFFLLILGSGGLSFPSK